MSSLDVSFNPDYLVVSGRYSEVMEEEVLPYLHAKQSVSQLEGAGQMPLYCVSYTADGCTKGTVVLVHGFTENAYKYAELIYSLLHSGFAVLTYDQRGHGRSGRSERISDPSVTHADRFEDYVLDLKILTDALLSDMPKPWHLFGHSMGGAVSALFLERYPEVFSAAVLTSPMIAPNTGVPAAAAGLISGIALAFRQNTKKPFFMQSYRGPEDFYTSCATDPSRFAWYDAVKYAHKEFHNSVPSYGWIRESIKVTDRILAPGAPESISCPVLLFSADEDHSVLPEPQKAFIARVPRGKRVFVKGSRHEIFRSADEVMFPWWHMILSFFEKSGVLPDVEALP